MYGEQESSSLVLQGALGRLRGKWIDAEVFGKEGRDGGVRYLLYSDDYHDPFRPGRTGTVRVFAESPGEKDFRFSCRFDLAEDGSDGDVFSGSKQVTLSGCFPAIAPIVANMESILVPGRGDGFSGPKPPEPSFWFSALPGFSVLNGEFHALPIVKTYRRRRSDLRERARRFSGKWVELEAQLVPGTAAPAVLAAFFADLDEKAFSGELWVEKEGETAFTLRAEARSGDSRLELRERAEDPESLRDLGLRWASSFSFLGRHLALQLR